MRHAEQINLTITSADYPRRIRATMLALNFIPLALLVIVALVSMTAPSTQPIRCLIAISVLYMLPPILARTLRVILKVPSGQFKVNSSEFLCWWGLSQFEMIFVRFGFLEEILRIVPGLYSSWLRLWGAKIGRLTYWSAGTTILDRVYLNIGDDVVFGAGVRLNAHVLSRDKNGQLELIVAPITVGDGALIGGYSLLTGGSVVGPGETMQARTILPPYSSYRHGRRHKGADE